jgi:hypothetical protein
MALGRRSVPKRNPENAAGDEHMPSNRAGEGRSKMRLRVVVAAVSGAVVVGVGVMFAAHVPEIDPATVPTGCSSRTTTSRTFRSRGFARAVELNGATR